MTNKVYYDLEFLEGSQTERFLGIPYGKTKPTIDLISIGMVRDDGTEYYAISKEFNLREAWDRYQMKQVHGDLRNTYPDGVREYWIRENVLRPIWIELVKKDPMIFEEYLVEGDNGNYYIRDKYFTYKNLKRLINKYGKTNAEIATEVERFCKVLNPITPADKPLYQKIELYGYYSAYDHVGLCWLFGKMINLPDGMPWYTIDLKQMLDGKAEYKSLNCFETINTQGRSKEWWINNFKGMLSYPKQTNEHNALQDAIFNKRLHEFINSL